MKYFLLSIFAFTLLHLSAQNETRSFLVMFYNVENLFDTINNPDTSDEEFLPSSDKKWDTDKYYKKLENVSKVILACDSGQIPDIIGIAEAENKTVLKDLCRTLHYQKPVYQFIHEDSGDPRGIDVALVYNPNRFSVVMWRKIPVMTPGQKETKDRDILYVKGTAPGGDTLHVFVNHWKSHVGGTDNTETRRVFAAMTLKARCDSILAINPAANLIILGDFNDDPENKSIFQILQANNKRRNRDLFDLYNLHYDIHNFYGAGTLFYENGWYLFDQIIISNHLLINSRGLVVRPDAGSILKHEWMLYKPEGKPFQPKPTYEGNKYIGGYSDHLPVFVKFNY